MTSAPHLLLLILFHFLVLHFSFHGSLIIFNVYRPRAMGSLRQAPYLRLGCLAQPPPLLWRIIDTRSRANRACADQRVGVPLISLLSRLCVFLLFIKYNTNPNHPNSPVPPPSGNPRVSQPTVSSPVLGASSPRIRRPSSPTPAKTNTTKMMTNTTTTTTMKTMCCRRAPCWARCPCSRRA